MDNARRCIYAHFFFGKAIPPSVEGPAQLSVEIAHEVAALLIEHAISTIEEARVLLWRASVRPISDDPSPPSTSPAGAPGVSLH